jgi:hypothetical protein
MLSETLVSTLQVRGSKELEILLNYDRDGPVGDSDNKMNLARLKLAIKYKQKKVSTDYRELCRFINESSL